MTLASAAASAVAKPRCIRASANPSPSDLGIDRRYTYALSVRLSTGSVQIARPVSLQNISGRHLTPGNA
jgi:hypothetical protein